MTSAGEYRSRPITWRNSPHSTSTFAVNSAHCSRFMWRMLPPSEHLKTVFRYSQRPSQEIFGCIVPFNNKRPTCVLIVAGFDASTYFFCGSRLGLGIGLCLL